MNKENEIRPSYKTSHSNPPPMLDIRATVREFIALPYTYLEMVQYNPSDAILLTFATCEVRIEGQRLDDLYTNLVQHVVEFIQENDAKYEEVALIVKGFDPEREPLGDEAVN